MLIIFPDFVACDTALMEHATVFVGYFINFAACATYFLASITNFVSHSTNLVTRVSKSVAYGTKFNGTCH